MNFRTGNIITYCWLVIIFASCVTIKDYPKGKPFFYENTVKVDGNLSSTARASLKEKLLTQIEDTARPEINTGFYFFKYGKIISTKRITAPPPYDTNAVIASAENMRILLMTQGYFRGQVGWSNPPVFKADKDSQEIRTYVTYTAHLNKEFRYEKIRYNFPDSGLAKLVNENKAASFLQPKEIFTKGAVNGEMDRLVNIFHNNGYYKLNREVMYAVIDTFPAALLDPSLSEVELIQQQIEAQKRRENPSIDIEIKQSENFDSNRIKKYIIGRILIIPDLRPDSVYKNEKTTLVEYDSLRIRYHDHIIHSSVLRRQIGIRPGEIYNQSVLNQTITNLNRIGVWQSVSTDALERNDTLINGERYGQLLLIYRLIPAVKYAYNFNLQASRNTSNTLGGVLNPGNLFGLSVEGTRSNRNFIKEGIQSNTTARFGVEFYRFDTIQTFEGSLNQTFVMPRFVAPFKIDEKKLINPKTFFNISGTYTNRRNFFELYQANLNWGYEWSTKKHSNVSYILRPFNLEYLYYPPSKLLDSLIKDNPFLRYTFNSGLIIGPAATVLLNLPVKKTNRRSILRFNIEESGYGGLIGAVINQRRILPYWKTDITYTHYINHAKSSFALRAYGGVGDAYGKDSNSNVIMPLPKRFVAGGPNSMRAWRLRKLGLGTMSRADSATDRLGDVQLEFNAEYRFNIFPVYGVMVEGAFFTDAGNVWVKSAKSAPENDPRGVFSLKNLYPGLAVDGGIGIRLNFTQFSIRLDWAYTLKDPQFADDNSGWFPTKNSFGKRQALQFNINYPF